MDENLIRVGDTDYYIWPDVYSWNVGVRKKVKPTEKNPKDHRMVRVTYHHSLLQVVEEVFNRQVKVDAQTAKNMLELAENHKKTVEWIRGLFPKQFD